MSSLQEAQGEMTKAVEHLKSEFSKMRVGRATTSMVDELKVEVYGSQMTMKEVATINTPDSRTITITPWDTSVISDIEKGLLASNLGITPNNDGKMIRLTLPPLTEDRRKDFVKQIKKHGEDAKISTRNTRRDVMDALKKQKDSGDLSEDDLKREQDETQKVTDKFIKEIDTLVDSKSEEVMSL